MRSPEPTPLSAAASALLSAPTATRVRMGVGAAVVLALLAVGVAVAVSMFAPRGEQTVVPAEAVVPTVGSSRLFVHVLGAVASPGLYEVGDGARLVDAVAAAGGFTDDADLGAVNLARFVSDGEQIVVPREGESADGDGAAPGVASDGRVNLNTADAATLETLPRVGPAVAARIIEWREAHGRFATVDDLLAVSGIGEKTLAGMRDRITV